MGLSGGREHQGEFQSREKIMKGKMPFTQSPLALLEFSIGGLHYLCIALSLSYYYRV